VNIYTEIYIGLAALSLLFYLPLLRRGESYARWIVLYLALCLITTAAAILLPAYTGQKNNLFVFHIFTPLEYTVLSLLYSHVISDVRIRKVIRTSIPLFLLLSLLLSIFIQGYKSNNSYTVILECILLILWSLFFLREILLLQQVTALHRFGLFWISVGILFLFTGSLIIEGMLNYLINHSMELARRVYRFGYVFKYLQFILLIVGACCRKPARGPVRVQFGKFERNGNQL
jgi:hypothetical protein